MAEFDPTRLEHEWGTPSFERYEAVRDAALTLAQFHEPDFGWKPRAVSSLSFSVRIIQKTFDLPEYTRLERLVRVQCTETKEGENLWLRIVENSLGNALSSAHYWRVYDLKTRGGQAVQAARQAGIAGLMPYHRPVSNDNLHMQMAACEGARMIQRELPQGLSQPLSHGASGLLIRELEEMRDTPPVKV